ncbi:hypothetical protein [Oscillatoria acuminata]|uniref:Calcium-binding protein n=1 Tax=Oscillatoria acuminata PCC 6304 TaxID=56110 RepID=K9TPK3_9CYAN|nr:hypothetical protein [Oscillatoria acuminata]AFY83944.1 hypothetical protein Oscil6304_4424 [Oscillatoria acuminata PCC 6304]
MNTVEFDETFYRAAYPDVQSAINSGSLRSGLEHFQMFGRQEGRTQISPFYNEQFYLNRYPDVANAVMNRAFISGIDHFLQFGLAEKRTGSLLFDETWYRQRYPDVANAVTAGMFQSGLKHYRFFGQTEGRSGTSFNEFAYKQRNPDVKTAVEAGSFNSGLEHYIAFGQFEERLGNFTGTAGDDTITGFGSISELSGVDIVPGPCLIGGSLTGGECLTFQSSGVNEVDVLIGGPGQDTFILGRLEVTRNIVRTVPFYVGSGNQDFARIQNFEGGRDIIQLAGAPSDYLLESIEGNVHIFRNNVGLFQSLPSPDLVAIVEAVPSLGEESLIFVQGSLGGSISFLSPSP